MVVGGGGRRCGLANTDMDMTWDYNLHASNLVFSVLEFIYLANK